MAAEGCMVLIMTALVIAASMNGLEAEDRKKNGPFDEHGRDPKIMRETGSL